MKPVPIDLSRLTDIDRAHVFLGVDDEIRPILERFPAILERVQNVIHFISQIGAHDVRENVCGYIRATLAEMVSIEDAQKDIVSAVQLMTTSGNPLLCVVRELRNVEIHLSSVTLSSRNQPYLWGDIAKPGDATEVDIQIHWIDNIDIESFRKLRYYEKYDDSAFKVALSWFDKNQRCWGIGELLYRAISEYAMELAGSLL